MERIELAHHHARTEQYTDLTREQLMNKLRSIYLGLPKAEFACPDGRTFTLGIGQIVERAPSSFEAETGATIPGDVLRHYGFNFNGELVDVLEAGGWEQVVHRNTNHPALDDDEVRYMLGEISQIHDQYAELLP